MGILDVGAGAATGLEHELARQLADEKFAESKRATRATEGYRNRSLEESTALRQQSQQSLDDNRKAAQQQQTDNRVSRTVAFRPVGSKVTPEEYDQERAAGVPEGVYKVKEVVGDDGTPGRDITYGGTETQQNANRDDSRAKESAAALAESREKSANAAESRAGLARERLEFDKEKDQYGKDHPKDPAMIVTQKRAAGNVKSHIGNIKTEADAVDKMGLMGPVGGRWGDWLTGKVGDSELAAGDPAKAKVLSKFRTDIGLLQSGMAMVHGGARGGGSIQMNKKFEDLINAKRMDRAGLEGALNSFDEWLTTYQGDPDYAINTGSKPQGGGTSGAVIKSIKVVK